MSWVEHLIPSVVSPPYNDTTVFDGLPEDIQVQILDIISDAYPLSSFFDRYITQSRGKKRMEQATKQAISQMTKKVKSKRTKTKTPPASTP